MLLEQSRMPRHFPTQVWCPCNQTIWCCLLKLVKLECSICVVPIERCSRCFCHTWGKQEGSNVELIQGLIRQARRLKCNKFPGFTKWAVFYSIGILLADGLVLEYCFLKPHVLLFSCSGGSNNSWGDVTDNAWHVELSPMSSANVAKLFLRHVSFQMVSNTYVAR